MKTLFVLLCLLPALQVKANRVFVTMGELQTDHLKAYGVAYWELLRDREVKWLVNYEGGSFLMDYSADLVTECQLRRVSFRVISEAEAGLLENKLRHPDVNMDVIPLNKAARIAVYSPKKISTADYEDTDAVMLVLDYAEIPYTLVYDEEIMHQELALYDWLHLHHEDFTGQYGKNLRRITREDVQLQQQIATQFNFRKVSDLKLEIARRIRAFCAGGGYLFAMCSGAESLDVALAAEGLDIVPAYWDGDPVDAGIDKKLDYSRTLAFGNFSVEETFQDNELGFRGRHSFSTINSGFGDGWGDETVSYFHLFEFSAKWDVIPALLTQNHQSEIREFIGQTTAFSRETVKPNVLVMGKSQSTDRYIYGELQYGQFAFYGGHDPEGRRGFHRIPTDLSLFPNSPGYRLILNNVLFPSANKKKRKT